MNEIPPLLTKNLEILARSQPKLAARLRGYLDGLPALPKAEFQETPAGRWVSGLTEKPFFEKKSSLEKRKTADPSAVYLIFGTGCAPWLFHVLRSLPREALSIVIFEPSLDLLLATLSETSVFAAVPGGCRISFIVSDENDLVDEVLAWNITPVGIFPVKTAQSIVHAGEEEACEFASLEKNFNDQVRYRLNMLGNSAEDTLLGFRHAALNVRHILHSPSMREIRKMYEGKPFVCVASGPSLVKNVHLLDGLQEKCVIVACDTVLHHLLERGIKPHAVTTLERAYSNYPAWVPPVLEDYPDACREILLLSQSVSYPLIAGRWPGPNVAVGKREVPVDNWFVGSVLGEQLMYSGLSVAHMSICFALLCGASSVALIGQDLAYAEEGHSHAPNTAPLSAVKREEERGRIPIEGSLGGTVLTNHMWKTFIQLFERIIAPASVPVFDCTEGGALIKGTRVLPFAEYISESVPDASGEFNRYEPENSSKTISLESVLTRVEGTLTHFDFLENQLLEMEQKVNSASAPALTPERRRQSASRTAEIMDHIHGMNPVISFIGQSYTHLSGALLAETRFLETVEDVKKWEALHREIILSHRSALAFLRQWTVYSKTLLLLEQKNVLVSEYGDSGERAFEDLFTRWSENDNDKRRGDNEAFIAVTDILSNKDPVREGWSPENLWKAARILHLQGRHDDARRFMQKGYDLLEGASFSREVMGEYFLDWGDMAGSPDLCVVTNFQEALTLVENSARFLGEKNGKVRLVKDKILTSQKKYYENVTGSAISDESDQQAYLLSMINKAQRALMEQNVALAMSLIEKLVWESLDSFPGTAIPHLQWLMKTASNCLEAADKGVAEQSSEIIDRIIERLPDLTGRSVEFPMEFLALLERKGIKFSFQPADTHREEE